MWPYTGKYTAKLGRKRISFAAGVVLALSGMLLISCSSPSSTTASRRPTIPKSYADYKETGRYISPYRAPVGEGLYSISRLMGESNNDDERADLLYDEKVLRIQAPVAGMGDTIARNHYRKDALLLKEDHSGSWFVTCVLDNDQKEFAASLRRGEQVILEGTVYTIYSQHVVAPDASYSVYRPALHIEPCRIE